MWLSYKKYVEKNNAFFIRLIEKKSFFLFSWKLFHFSQLLNRFSLDQASEKIKPIFIVHLFAMWYTLIALYFYFSNHFPSADYIPMINKLQLIVAAAAVKSLPMKIFLSSNVAVFALNNITPEANAPIQWDNEKIGGGIFSTKLKQNTSTLIVSLYPAHTAQPYRCPAVVFCSIEQQCCACSSNKSVNLRCDQHGEVNITD